MGYENKDCGHASCLFRFLRSYRASALRVALAVIVAYMMSYYALSRYSCRVHPVGRQALGLQHLLRFVGPDEGPGRKTAKAVERPFHRPITQLKLGVNERREAGYSTEKVEEPVCILDVFSGFRPENDH